MKRKLNGKWCFYLQDFPLNTLGKQDLWARDYDDSDWKKVTVPYDWAVSYPFDKKNSSGTGYLPGGTGWFRYHFNTDKDALKNAFICFEGVYKHSRVWLNGYYLGNWQNGFTAFEMNASEALKKDGTENVLVVCVDHPDIADCRWYTGSGIMRPVYIKYTNDVYFPEHGVKFEFKNNEISIAAVAENLSEKDVKAKVEYKICDAEGKAVAEDSSEISVKALCEENVKFNKTVSDLEKWSPENPYLYTLTANIYVDGKLSDTYTNKIGFRELEFNPDKGFFCNGKNYKLKGLCLHEDAGCWGNAVPKDVWRRRLQKLQDAGCNAIRMSHNPHSEELYELCDEMGFFVMDEVYDEWQEPKNKWWQGHNVYPPSHQGITDDFLSCYEKDVRSFITKRWNHPSIIMWSIGNEIDYPNDPYCSPKFKEMTGNNDASKPAAERQFNPNHPDIGQIAGIAKMLSREVKKWDVSRPVTMALAFPELSSDTGVMDALDVIGYNYKEQFYADDHKRFPNKMIVGSENQHAKEFWQAVTDNEYIAGQFLWTGVDYLGEAKGWPVHGSPAGLLTLAGFEKPMYYFRKALWSNEKFVKIYTALSGTDNWNEGWNYCDGEDVDVRVYTNEKSVAIYLGEDKIDEADAEKAYAEFTVNYVKGKELVAKAGDEMDVVMASGASAKLNVEVDASDELAQLEIFVTDENGNFAATDSSLITVEVEGDAELAGLENGDLADVTEYSANYRHTYNGKLIAYVRKCGNAVVTVKSAGIKEVKVNL